MAIKVSQAFERTSANPVDVTLALTKAQMLTVNDNLMPAYYFTICQDDGYIYLYDKTATPTVTTGKFTKFEGSGSGVPDGGTTGQALVKKSNTDGDVEWSNVSGVPTGGQTGQVLTKKSNTDGDVEWKIPSSTQYGTMPIASSAYTDKIIQYTGTTTSTYTNGYFYKCIENTSVTPYTYSWEEIQVSKDKEGHTILDTDGNAKTQRGSLQFTGLDVADDSTNNKTEVKPFGLNSDDLDEIIDTSEISNVYIQSAFNYSLEEQVIGRWIDGRPLYQKTWTGTISFNSGTEYNLVTSLPANIDNDYSWVDDSASFICSYPGISNSGTRQSGFTYSDSYIQMWLGNATTIKFRCDGMGSGTNIPYVCTLKYTKTTD